MHSRYGALVLALATFIAGADAALANDAAIGRGDPNRVIITDGGRTGDMVTFESLNLPPGTQIDPPAGQSTAVDGYVFTPGPNDASGLNDSHFGNAVTFWSYNGTHVAAFHDDVVITKVGGGAFDLVQFDLAGWPGGFEVPFTVTAQPGGAVANFTPDGLVDGPGGVVDFQTFTLPANGFESITSATIEHTGPATLQGIFVIDNVALGKPLSVEPKSWGAVKGDFKR